MRFLPRAYYDTLLDIRTVQSIFLLFLTFSLFISFTGLSQIPAAGYVILGLTFIPASVVGAQSDSKFHAVFTILILSFGIKLIVIDPVEIGLYGGDPVWTYNALLEFRTTSDLGRLFTNGGWPLLYVFTDLLLTILSVETIVVAKYLPLTSILAPIFFYLFARLVSSHNCAFFSTLGVVVLRNTTTFHTRFVDETVAIGLVFLTLYLIGFTSIRTPSRLKRGIVLLLISAAALTLSHPMAALLSAGIILAVGIAAVFRDPPLIHTEVEPEDRTGVLVSLLITMGVIGLFVYTVPYSFAGFILDILSDSVSTNPGTSASGENTTVLRNIRILLSTYGHILMIGVLSIIVFLGAVSKRVPTNRWDLACVLVGGVLTGLYIVQILAGRLLAYDPFRYLIFFVPFILLYAFKIIESQKIRRYSPTKTMLIQMVVVSLVVVTQIAAIPPHVMYSDPSTKPLDSKGHFTAADYSMIDFSTNYVGDTRSVIAYETALWGYGEGAVNYRIIHQKCDNKLIVGRKHAPPLIVGDDRGGINKIYTNSKSTINLCR